ncbi:MAG: hypothetical protein AABY33_01560 [Pseudomonadota bacterium]
MEASNIFPQTHNRKPVPVAGGSEIEHASPDVNGKSAAEYVYEAMAMHEKPHKGMGTPPPKFLEWIGNAALSNAPKTRFSAAAGLTAGLITAGTIANIVTGYSLSGKKITNVPAFLKPFNGIIKGYEPGDITPRNKFIRYAHATVYTLGGMLGIKLATDMVYKKSKEKDKNPIFLEDYLAHISKMQSDNWSVLSAISGGFGSAAGLFLIPLPGFNYSINMVGGITSMQDRNTTVGGLNKIISGATTDSYLRLKEGAYYLANYAVGNPAKDPEKIEYIAYSILGPIFKEQLTAKHIKQFTDAVHEVRDHYWQEGGIPKDKRAEATDTMKQVFTGAGLEVLLIDMGLNPASVMFDKVNGIIGKIGNVGKADKIKEKQDAYWTALQERLPKYVAANIISQERADWVNESIADMKQGKPPKPAPVIKSEVVEAQKKLESSPKTKETSIDKLIKSSTKPGDWRESILKRRQESESPRLVAE